MNVGVDDDGEGNDEKDDASDQDVKVDEGDETDNVNSSLLLYLSETVIIYNSNKRIIFKFVITIKSFIYRRVKILFIRFIAFE